mmetsp:Transcript_6269/g.13893  ORF Transcript_6269/g.13893 Transcript_6269/m.13893 type:complete len:365 (+) Transcript_6269:1-1095(+)
MPVSEFITGTSALVLVQQGRAEPRAFAGVDGVERCSTCSALGLLWCPSNFSNTTGRCTSQSASESEQCFDVAEECPTLRTSPAGKPLPKVSPLDESMRDDWDSSPMVDKEHRLIFCEHPKVACSEFKRLFMRLSGQAPREFPQLVEKPSAKDLNWLHHPKTNRILRLNSFSAEEASQMMADKSWTKAVFVRDPLERLLSGYLDKCRMLPEEWRSKGNCPSNGYISFPDFVKAVFAKASDWDGLLAMNAHWRPQSINCDLYKWLEYYQFQGNFSHLGPHSKYLLQSLGLYDKYGHGWQKYGYGWSDTEDGFELFAEKPHDHKLRDAGNKVEEYFTKELADFALDFYRKDYELFSLPRPSWYEKLQ